MQFGMICIGGMRAGMRMNSVMQKLISPNQAGGCYLQAAVLVDRTSRQIRFSGIGISGPQRMLDARVAIAPWPRVLAVANRRHGLKAGTRRSIPPSYIAPALLQTGNRKYRLVGNWLAQS